MSRFLIVGTTLGILCQLALAQNEPNAASYNLANFHSYVLSPTGADWQTAQAFSRTMGGYLASVNNVGEQAFINSKYSTQVGGFWIGLSDAAAEGTYVWDSGEPLTYSAWCPGEPNNANGIEDYVHAAYTPLGFCWNDISSPYMGPNSAPNQALIEMEHGDRVNFDYGFAAQCTVLPAPFGASGNPDGISWNGAGAGALHNALVTHLANAQMPVNGPENLLLQANGPVTVPLGGPFLRPAPAGANEVRIPIPAGTQGVSYAWEFLTAEGLNSLWNDGLSIAVVDSTGHLIHDLTYADTGWVKENNVPGYAYCFIPAVLVFPVGEPGVQTTSHVLPPLPEPAYLSIVCWNGADNAVTSAAAVDAIHFWGSGQFKLTMSAPFGPGSIQIVNSNGVAGNGYVTAMTVAPGAFPNGWLFGLDIPAEALLNQITAGAPFQGTLNASGLSGYVIGSGVPAGIPLYAVSMQFTAGGPFGGSFVNASTPEFFVTQ